jgi:hypothetical protein
VHLKPLVVIINFPVVSLASHVYLRSNLSMGRFRDECLNEHCSLAMAHAHVEAWRREYNEERPKKGLGGRTPPLMEES